MASDGNPNLGGQDIENAIIKRCIEDIKEEHKIDLNVKNDASDKAKAKLRKAAKLAKESLSAENCNETEVMVEVLHEDLDEYSFDLGMADFNEICIEIFNQIEPLIC